MKYLEALKHDDDNTLELISEIKQTNSYPMLREALADIKAQYEHYIEVKGDAWQLNQPLTLVDGLPGALKTHYGTKPANLDIINTIRDEVSPDVCPMCGSPKPAQVDHVAPKDTYPEYAFFTKNLVPACDCNGFKGITFKGPAVGQRVLHPYYDEVMRQRLVYVEFLNDFGAPDTEIRICQPHQTNAAVSFHVDNILRKTRLLLWADKKWATIRRRPEVVFPLMQSRGGLLTVQVVRDVINAHVDAKDAEFGTPNNWESMVYTGILLSNGAPEYITARVNGLRSGEIFPD